MVWVGRDLIDHLVPTPLPWTGANISIHISSSFKKAQHLCFGPKLLVCV